MLKRKYSALFIGTRIEALEELKKKFNVLEIITIKNSFVHYKYKESLIINSSNKIKIFEFIKTFNVDLVFSAGFPFILHDEVLKYYKKRIFLNSHPSYLPNFKGKKSIDRIFISKKKLFGCSVHLMKKKVDSGKIIFQKMKTFDRKKNINQIKKFIFSKLEPETVFYSLKKIIPLLNDSIFLRKLTMKDCKKSVKWRNNFNIWRHTKPNKHSKLPKFTINDEEDWFKKVAKNNRLNLAIIHNFKEYIGNVYLSNITKKKAKFEIFIGEENKWNKGLGFKTLLITIKIAKERYNLKELYLYVKKTNLKAIRIYKKANFKINYNLKKSDFHYMILKLK